MGSQGLRALGNFIIQCVLCSLHLCQGSGTQGCSWWRVAKPTALGAGFGRLTVGLICVIQMALSPQRSLLTSTGLPARCVLQDPQSRAALHLV